MSLTENKNNFWKIYDHNDLYIDLGFKPTITILRKAVDELLLKPDVWIEVGEDEEQSQSNHFLNATITWEMSMQQGREKQKVFNVWVFNEHCHYEFEMADVESMTQLLRGFKMLDIVVL